MAFPICHTDPASTNDATVTHTVGGLYTNGEAGKVFRYVQFKDAVTYAAGQVCTLANAAGTAVTNDISGGSSIGSVVGGICQGVMTADYYGFVQVAGYYATVKTSGADDIAIGEAVFVHGSTDGTCDGASASTFSTGNFGVAVAADSDANNTVAVQIRGLI
jgi:hypothetical protein